MMRTVFSLIRSPSQKRINLHLSHQFKKQYPFPQKSNLFGWLTQLIVFNFSTDQHNGKNMYFGAQSFWMRDDQGVQLLLEGKLEEALLFYENELRICTEKDQKEQRIRTLEIISDVYIKSNELKKAFEFSNLSRQEYNKIDKSNVSPDFWTWEYGNLLHFSNLYYNTGDRDTALVYANKLKELCIQNKAYYQYNFFLDHISATILIILSQKAIEDKTIIDQAFQFSEIVNEYMSKYQERVSPNFLVITKALHFELLLLKNNTEEALIVGEETFDIYEKQTKVQQKNIDYLINLTSKLTALFGARSKGQEKANKYGEWFMIKTQSHPLDSQYFLRRISVAEMLGRINLMKGDYLKVEHYYTLMKKIANEHCIKLAEVTAILHIAELKEFLKEPNEFLQKLNEATEIIIQLDFRQEQNYFPALLWISNQYLKLKMYPQYFQFADLMIRTHKNDKRIDRNFIIPVGKQIQQLLTDPKTKEITFEFTKNYDMKIEVQKV